MVNRSYKFYENIFYPLFCCKNRKLIHKSYTNIVNFASISIKEGVSKLNFSPDELFI